MRNPYQPPAAPVTHVPDSDAATRPLAVTRAVQLLWATFAAGFVLATIEVIAELGTNPYFWLSLGVAIGTFAVIFGISFWIYGAIYAGRNWARILLLVLTIVVTLILFAAFAVVGWMAEIPADIKRELLISGSQFAVTFVATALLFRPSANRWYRAVKAARN
ncbi:MAG: hypothetical protein H7Y89_10805 [Steroidobacteraceae bacterium]|nr:hypothetical protein [Steroidobacteraceae bacterium]